LFSAAEKKLERGCLASKRKAAKNRQILQLSFNALKDIQKKTTPMKTGLVSEAHEGKVEGVSDLLA
jgi:hypothetical protein